MYRAIPINWAFRRWFYSVVIFVPMLISANLLAQDADGSNEAKPEKLFKSENTLAVTLSAPWRDIVRNEEVQDPYPATIQYTDESGQPRTLPLTVERRGLTRQRVCKYPPIKLKFDKETVKGTLFRGQKSIKMVTHCDKGDRWEQYYIKEMLAYQMYNLVTDRSFRVRPLSITYVDSEKGSTDDPRFAFLIEDDSDVAKRNDLKKLKVIEVEPDQLEPMESSRFALFQYLIGNVDWSALSGPKENKCCHNAKLIGDNEQTNIYAVPYDFDSAGIVDAHYAAPNENLPIRRVTDRLYRGFCASNSTLPAARQEFLALEPQILGLVQNEPLLSKRNVRVAERYLEEFFDTLKDDSSFNKRITAKCRK